MKMGRKNKMPKDDKIATWKILVAAVIGMTFMIVFSNLYYTNRLPESLPFENKIELQLVWDKEFMDSISPYWDISQYGEIVCANNKGTIYTIDTSSGNQIDEKLLTDKGNSVVLVIDSSNIFAIIDSNILFELDLKTGQVQDIIKSDSKDLYDDNIIYYDSYLVFWNDMGGITVLDLNTDRIVSKSLYFFGAPIAYLNIYNNIIYYSQTGFNVYAVDLKSLNKLWQYEVGHGPAHSNPVIIDDKIYLQVEEKIVIFDYLRGNIINQINRDVVDIYTDGINLYAYTSRYFLNLNKESGETIWKHRDKVFVRDFLFVDDCIFYEAGERPAFVKLDKEDGKKIWEFDLRDYSFHIEKVVSTDKYDIIERNDGYIFILDKNTGKKLWRFNDTVDPDNLKWEIYDNKLIIFDGLDHFYSYSLNEI